MSQIHSLIYVSAASRLLSAADLEDILLGARTSNQANGITGLLLHASGNFMQLLEGPPEAVRSTFARIKTSTRHHQVIELTCAPVAQRDFPEWSMAVSRATAPEFLAMRNASWASGAPGEGQRKESIGKELLMQFWRTTR